MRFSESVQYVDALEEPGDVADPVLRLGVDSYLLYASSNASHRLPVVRLQPLLDAQQLESSYPPGWLGEHPDVASGRPQPEQALARRR